MTAALGADVRRLVIGAPSSTDHERDAVADFATFFGDDHGPVSRDDGPHHATASALVFDPSLTHTLLVFHTKGRFWVQPGGHLEPEDVSIAEAALRELREETGVDVPALAEPLVYDLDHHSLSSAFGRCGSHLDIGVGVIVGDGLDLVVSEESEDVRWWPIDALPAQVPDGFPGRVRQLRDRLVRQR